MREKRDLEFKREITNTFLKTVSAFANFGDGKIIFGIDDDGEAVGIENPQSHLIDIENRINDSISPRPDFSLSVENGLIVLSVIKGKYTPYFYKGKVYRRSDTASVEVSDAQLRDLILAGERMSYEELPCKNKELTFSALEKKMQSTLRIKSISNDILRTLGFISEDGLFNNAGAVFADINSFPGIDIARFGESINEIMDRETISGCSILNMYDKAIEFFDRYYCYEKIEGFERKTVELVPREAFREALANALVHRNWSIPSHIRISMFKDKIEINSPGGLPEGISEGEYLSGQISRLRNPIIGNLFFRLNIIEMFGTGIKRIKSAYSASAKMPEFAVSENIIGVTLPVKESVTDMTAEEKTIMAAFSEKSILTTSELTRITDYNKAKVLRTLGKLIERNLIEQSGSGRATVYRIK